ncbi:unnamed protein product [Rotaria sp. Silwood1]|nr:unnamed protein product [Rotaria sp. Silwood1]CAF3338958.1 unnamed protein product [Rotaria sp. Silwood1]CAF3361301.1 unnamed protein product [Rotaria sp. Silwood1]CAF3399188.1 unnamed protein product [Rotaria sp. Silwood1]CAF4662953.1 unnamed protein product [Rotaria sp. Silwood1]
MHSFQLFLFLFIITAECYTVVNSTTQTTILFIPLDERFTTRSIVLNLARLIDNDFVLLTPPIELISHWKQPANTSVLFHWIHDQIINSCSRSTSCSLLISTEQLIYGGLINSRISNTSLDELNSRLTILVGFKREFGSKLQIYLSSVIMRIPAYNGDFEEPNYWATYGRLIYLWSFYTDRYAVLHNPADEEQVQILEKQIPSNILNEFIWRRARNYNLTYTLLHDYTKLYFERIWLTLDDNAEYGLNKAEERQLIKLINDPSVNISSKVNIYPGADEVSLAILSQLVVNNKQQQSSIPTITVRYRNVTTKNYIPNYEGAPLNGSILKQITAVGGHYIEFDNETSADILVLVNNWSTDMQQEATQVQTCEDYSTLEIQTNTSIIVYADVRYSNGGDICFSQWILNHTLFGTYAYAGWNTNGNTLGTCLSNGVLLKYYLNSTLNNQLINRVLKENRRFTLYRFIEDVHYQAYLRQLLLGYLTYISLDPPDKLNNDPNFYETFIQKGFISYENKITNEFNVNNVYYPWNRTFEIGFQLTDNESF